MANWPNFGGEKKKKQAQRRTTSVRLLQLSNTQRQEKNLNSPQSHPRWPRMWLRLHWNSNMMQQDAWEMRSNMQPKNVIPDKHPVSNTLRSNSFKLEGQGWKPWSRKDWRRVPKRRRWSETGLLIFRLTSQWLESITIPSPICWSEFRSVVCLNDGCEQSDGWYWVLFWWERLWGESFKLTLEASEPRFEWLTHWDSFEN